MRQDKWLDSGEAFKMDMDWITEKIVIGNFIDAKNASSSELDAILCLKANCCDENNDEFEITCIPLVDGPGNNYRYLDQAVSFIDEVVSRGDKILVHCHAGRSRSVCIVARYFMVKHDLTSHQALESIKVKREIYLSPGIETILDVKAY